MKGKSKKYIIILIILLSIGFAAITTTLFINGTIRFGSNREDFEKNLIFTAAELTYSDPTKNTETSNTATISENGKSISFTVNTLKTLKEYATLKYEISNNSQYIAVLDDMTCTVDEIVDSEVIKNVDSEYISITPEKLSGIEIASKEKLSEKKLTITLAKSYVGTATSNEATYNITCTINATAKVE